MRGAGAPQRTYSVHMKQIRTVVSLLGLALVVLAPSSVPASLGIDVAPAKLDISIPAGQAFNIPITVHNSSTSNVHVQATMVDFGVAPNGDYQIQRVGSRPYSLMKWASINPREFDLPANTTQQVRLSVSVPSGGVSGEYAGIVFFQTRPDRRAGNTVAFSARVATKIYDVVPNTQKMDGAISKMTAIRGLGGQSYRVLFKNTGNTHVYLRGTLEVKRNGSTVDRIVLPSEVLVERGGERLIEVTGKKLEPGHYSAIALVDYGGKAMTGGEISFDAQ